MDLSTNFYSKEFPSKGDIITILMSEPENDIVKSSIEEYPTLRAIMQIGDLTSKKRIRSVRQYLHKKPVPAEVTDIDTSTGIISVSRRYLKGIEGKYSRYYQIKLKLLNIVKNILRKNPDEDLTVLVKDIIYPIIDYVNIKEVEQPPDIFKVLEDNIDSDDFPDLGKYNKEIVEYLNKMFKEKPQKVITKFKLICSVSVNNIIELFNRVDRKYPKVKFKLETCPDYYFETFGLEDNERKYHQEIITFIKSMSKELQISIQLEN